MASQQKTRSTSQQKNQSSSASAFLNAPANAVQEYPLSTAMLVFGVGIGVGVLVSHTLCDVLLRAVEPPPTMTERLTRQLYDALSQAVPHSVAKRFAA